MAQKYRVLALREIKLSDREGKTHTLKADQPIAEIESDFALGTVLSMVQFKTAKLVEIGGKRAASGEQRDKAGGKPQGNSGGSGKTT